MKLGKLKLIVVSILILTLSISMQEIQSKRKFYNKETEHQRNKLQNHQKKARKFWGCFGGESCENENSEVKTRENEKKKKKKKVLYCCYNKNKNYVDLKANSMDDCIERNGLTKNYSWEKFPDYEKCSDLISKIHSKNKSIVDAHTLDFHNTKDFKKAISKGDDKAAYDLVTPKLGRDY